MLPIAGPPPGCVLPTTGASPSLMIGDNPGLPTTVPSARIVPGSVLWIVSETVAFVSFGGVDGLAGAGGM